MKRRTHGVRIGDIMLEVVAVAVPRRVETISIVSTIAVARTEPGMVIRPQLIYIRTADSAVIAFRRGKIFLCIFL